MNKLERKLKGISKFKKRLINHGITEKVNRDGYSLSKGGIIINFNCYRTTGKPCSCTMCSPGKVKEKSKYRLDKFNKKDIYE